MNNFFDKIKKIKIFLPYIIWLILWLIITSIPYIWILLAYFSECPTCYWIFVIPFLIIFIPIWLIVISISIAAFLIFFINKRLKWIMKNIYNIWFFIFSIILLTDFNNKQINYLDMLFEIDIIIMLFIKILSITLIFTIPIYYLFKNEKQLTHNQNTLWNLKK